MSALDKNTNLKLPLHTVASFSALAAAHKGVFLCLKKNEFRAVVACTPQCGPAVLMYEKDLHTVDT